MPITKTGRYSMNPAYAEALDRAAQDNSADDGQNDSSDDGTDNPQGASQKGAVKRIEIEPAENGGFVSRTHRDPAVAGESAAGDKRDGWAPPYDEPELRAHPDGAHLMKFLGRELAK